MSDSFLWHDYETFGADPRRDRPAQFAALRTDPDLQPVGDPLVVYCRPASDVLPHPAACLITGITPQQAQNKGLPENEFASAIADAMTRPGTCSVGFNNFRFDDEITRHLFWRNFFDPYAREYANGNTRFDLIDLARMTRALRPTGLRWPDRADGTPSFRLEDLASANGLDTSRAHDALADVEATLGLARLIRNAQPRLWDWALSLRFRHKVVSLLEARQPLLHASAKLPARHCATAPVLPLGEHPQIGSQWVVWNLREDPRPFLGLSDELLHDLLWTAKEDLPDEFQRLPIKLVRSNRCPMLSPMAVLDQPAARRLGIEAASIEAHARILDSNPDFCDRLRRLFSSDAAAPVDPELALYAGFVPRGDLSTRDRVRQLKPDQLKSLGEPFTDQRLNELLFRYRARLWPDTLDEAETADWERYRRRRLLDDPDLASIQLAQYRSLLGQIRLDHPDRLDLIRALEAWPETLGFAPHQGSVSMT